MTNSNFMNSKDASDIFCGACGVKQLNIGQSSARRFWRKLLLGSAVGIVGVCGLGQGALAQSATSGAAACDPYKDYSCLDSYLGDDFFSRVLNYYSLEMGQSGPPTDPNAPPGRRDGWPATPETTPPMPFTE